MIVSTDFEEVAKVCHRALVFDRGRVVAELGVDGPVRRATCSPRRPRASSAAALADAANRIRHGVTMQSIKSNALEPTRPELAALSRVASDRPAAAGLRPAAPDAAADRFLLDPAAGHVPDLRSTCARSSADKAIIALLSLAATLPMMAGRIDLTVGFGIVHVAHPGDQPAGHVRHSLAGRDPARRRLRRLGRPASTDCWSRSRRSTPSSRRSAPARSSMRWRSGTPTGARSSARCRQGFIAINTTSRVRHPDPRLLCRRPGDRALDRQRAPADRTLSSTRSAPTRRRRR